MEDLEVLLRSNAIFASLPPLDLKELARLASGRMYEKDEKVILYGDVWPYLLFVAKGSVEAVKESAEGRNLLVTTFPKGQTFWGLAFFQDDAPMPVTLQAHESSLIYLWSRETVMPILIRNGQSAWELCRLMAVRMQYASEILEGLAFQSVAGRVARLLLEQYPAHQSVVPRHLTLDEMASRVGTTREIVCRILYRFAEQGAIQINRTEFTFMDRSLLEEQSHKN